MELIFNVTKETKKSFIKEVSDITGEKAVCQFTPTYAYAVGFWPY